LGADPTGTFCEIPESWLQEKAGEKWIKNIDRFSIFFQNKKKFQNIKMTDPFSPHLAAVAMEPTPLQLRQCEYLFHNSIFSDIPIM